ncbi:hypothetical protein BN7_3585 [Wickerhamomyces ciferrii]|uniref:Uncharacterized protein n=1 Tax=Wickerhamomyces ciferrii (strain ATCC 14091 / BCRC 22168 / CBS 111 / JCM 3599 / NBRC 0793 / NRRL Y-1031 F-60-10) TaxID=1206466 RepID=K0KRQ4_WICCF|nr:uncharacterized protein BN7_3585 [Wickerhamomyces ciferrii]CCH44028.1 hypothetical protein BN7_3585 [Wickerhamomyces ciferrii]
MNILNLSKQSPQPSAPWNYHHLFPTPKPLISRQIAPPAIQPCLSSRYHKSSIIQNLNPDAFSKINNETAEKEASAFGVFPLELWYEIMSSNDNVGVLVTLNKSFYNAFAPQLYGKFENLNLLLVISSTKKMKQNDELFISNAKVFFRDKLSCYDEICERYQQGTDYDYEYIDVVPNEEEYRDSMELINSTNKVITSHKKIIELFENILTNDISFIKKIIRNLTINISILNGYNEIISSKHSKVNRTLRKINKVDGVEKHHIRLPRFEGSNCLRQNRPNCSRNRYFNDQDSTFFPINVYSNEQSHLAVVLETFASDKKNYMRNIHSSEDLEGNNPFYDMFKICFEGKNIPINDRIIEGGARFSTDFQSMAHKVKVINRKFENKSQVEHSIIQIVKIMTSDKFMSSISTSLSLMGYEDSSNNSKKGPRDYVLSDLKPTITLVNKPSRATHM